MPATTRLLPAVPATDEDAGDVLTFSLASGRQGSTMTTTAAPTTFGIDRVGGVLFQRMETLDSEAIASYTLVVRATDRYGLSATTEVRIRVRDVNERPSLRSQHVSIPESYALSLASHSQHMSRIQRSLTTRSHTRLFGRSQ